MFSIIRTVFPDVRAVLSIIRTVFYADSIRAAAVIPIGFFRLGVGTFGGSEDHTAILCCAEKSLSVYDTPPPLLPSQYRQRCY